MLFVFVLGINQYYLPLFCITMQKDKKKQKKTRRLHRTLCLLVSIQSLIHHDLWPLQGSHL